MILLEYWPFLESIIILSIPALVFWKLIRSAKQSRADRVSPPTTLVGKISFGLFYVLRIAAMGLGTFLIVVLFVLIERNVYSVLTETRPAPSMVELPAGLPFQVEEVTFEGGQGLRMAGWRVPSQNGATIILLHGYGGNRTAMLWHARQLIQAGYGVLMYDERASGESEGTRRSYGWDDPDDVQGAVRFIETESGSGVEQIGIAGCSIGAQIALRSAVICPEIKAVWADGPSSVRARDLPTPKNPIVALVIAGNYSLDWLYEQMLAMESPPALIDTIGSIAPRPIMLVGGGKSQPLVGNEGERMVPRYAHYAGPNAQTWVIPEAVHCDGPARRPEEYAQRMVEFFDTVFGIKR